MEFSQAQPDYAWEKRGQVTCLRSQSTVKTQSNTLESPCITILFAESENWLKKKIKRLFQDHRVNQKALPTKSKCVTLSVFLFKHLSNKYLLSTMYST